MDYSPSIASQKCPTAADNTDSESNVIPLSSMTHGPVTTGSTPSSPMYEVQSPTLSMLSDGPGSVSERRHGRSRRKEPDYERRPPNQWNIFVADYEKNHEGEKLNGILMWAAAEWKLLSEEQREPYRERARLEAEAHKEKHPDYRYRPQKGKGKGKKPDVMTPGPNSVPPPIPGTLELVIARNAPAHSQDQVPEIPPSPPYPATIPVGHQVRRIDLLVRDSDFKVFASVQCRRRDFGAS